MNIWFSVFCFFCVINPFVSYDTNIDNIKGEYVIGDIGLSYGNINNDNLDGLLIFKDINTGQEIRRIIYDDLGFESFVYLADVGNDEFIVVCERYYLSQDFEIPYFKDVLLIKYNIQGNKLCQLILQDKPLSYNNHNNYFIIGYRNGVYKYINNNLSYKEEIVIEDEYLEMYEMKFQGEAFVNGELVDNVLINYPGNYEILIKNGNYQYVFSIVIHPKVIINGNKNDYLYYGQVSVESSGEIYINGCLYFSGQIIDTCGFYTIEIYGKNEYYYTETITIIPTITYTVDSISRIFSDGIIIDESMQIYSDCESMILNGVSYDSTLINETGIYTLEIYGVNEMYERFNFTIIPNVTGLEDLGVYEAAEFTVFGEAMLNGNACTGYTYLDESGDYRLELIFEGNTYEIYDFQVKKDVDTSEYDVEEKFNYNYIFFIVIAIGAILFLRKK